MQTYEDLAYILDNQLQQEVEILHVTYNGEAIIKRLPECINLKGLVVTLMKPLPDAALLGKLPLLQRLTVYGHCDRLEFPQELPHLQELYIKGEEQAFVVPLSIQHLKGLEVLKLQYLHITAISYGIGALERLAQLNIWDCQITGEVPDCLAYLPALRTVSLERSNFPCLPANIRHRGDARLKMRLDGSNVAYLPDGYVDAIDEITFDGSPLHSKMGKVMADNLPAFLGKLRQCSDVETRTALFKLYTQHFDSEVLEDIHLLTALNFADKHLRVLASSYWYRRYPSPFPPQAPMRLHLSPPKDFQLPWEEILPLLEEQGIEITQTLDENATHLIAGNHIAKNVWRKAWQLKIPIVSYGHFYDYLLRLEGELYLQGDDEGTKQMAENLLNLLKSDDTTNVELGLQMALGGGLHEAYLYEILLLYIWAHQHETTHKVAERVLQKHLPIDAFQHLKLHLQAREYYPTEAKITHYLTGISSRGFFEAGKIGKSFLERFGVGKQFCMMHPESFVWYCESRRKNGVLRLQDIGMEHLLPTIGKLSYLKILYLHKNKLTALPAEMAQLTRLDTLNLENNAFTAFPLVLAQMPHIASLSLAHNRIASLPAEIGKMQGLTTLNLQHTGIEDLPEEIYALPALRKLEIGNTPLAKKRKKIQERMELNGSACRVEASR